MQKVVKRGRITILILLTLTLLVSYVIQIFRLQIIQGHFFLNVSDRISTRRQIVPAQRGIIYDRWGEPLVFHEDRFTIQVIPSAVDSTMMSDLKIRLAERLDLSMDFIERRLPEGIQSRDPITIQEGVPFSQMAFFAENRELFPGVIWENRPQRIYAEDAGIAHILGYVAEINEEELQLLFNEGYRRGDRIGKSGVERQFDSFLRGRPGQQSFMVDARGHRIEENIHDRIMPETGASVRLTIDMRVQRLAYDAMDGRRGSVVVLRPATGEILAMVSNPVFNANTFSQRGDGGLGTQILDPNFPFINRAISSVYPAASLFKVVTQAAILEEGEVSPDFRVFCPGYIRIGNQIFRCHRHAGHGWQNLTDALANSCNVYFWTITNDFLGRDSRGAADPSRLAAMARDLGLGSYTDIDLPGERRGIIPDAAWKEDTFNTPWVGGDTMNMAIGQGFVQVTPLQIANVTAMVANHGSIYRPRVVHSIFHEENQFEQLKQPELLHQSRVRNSTWQRLAADMRATVTRGTGWVLTRAVTVAGKTGTAETGVDRQFHDWFMAYAPYQTANPEEQIVVVVQIEANETYEWWSSKVADFIIHGYFTNRDYIEVLRSLRPWYMNWRAVTGDPWPVVRPAVVAAPVVEETVPTPSSNFIIDPAVVLIEPATE